GKNSLNRLIRCVCGKKIGPDPRNFNQRVSLGRNDLLIRTFPREPVRDCLKSFEQNSNASLQLYCWEKAFKIWSKWDFDILNERHLFSVSASEIDYPVVQYFINNMNAIERQNFIDNTINKISFIDSTWHSSKSDLISYYYRFISSLQLPYHANLAIKKPDEGINLSLHFKIEFSKYSKLFFEI
ncbi:hypothetical protein RCD82_27735, partial [Klebsiella pneumoniae]|nr:hypothetical protein [Klebsiella pneumoniae]MDQ5108371.1 hypothetical protein [Klebsiella pneumoniae]